jgi:hypothetical protein
VIFFDQDSTGIEFSGELTDQRPGIQYCLSSFVERIRKIKVKAPQVESLVALQTRHEAGLG